MATLPRIDLIYCKIAITYSGKITEMHLFVFILIDHENNQFFRKNGDFEMTYPKNSQGTIFDDQHLVLEKHCWVNLFCLRFREAVTGGVL